MLLLCCSIKNIIFQSQEYKLSENEVYNATLNNEFLKIMKYFINLSNNDNENYKNVIELCNEKYNFSIFTILIRRFCSKTIDKVLNKELTEYFQALFNTSCKIHKKLIKKFSSNSYLADSHIDFLKFYSINAQKLFEFGIELKNVKFCQSLFAYILSLDENFVKNNKDYYLKLNKTFTICLNSMDIESFKDILKLFDDSAMQYDSFKDCKKNLLKVMRILKILSCDTDLAESLKDEFTVYIQKVCYFKKSNF
jgi:hypothetical protein